MELQKELGVYVLLIFLVLGVIGFLWQKQGNRVKQTNEEVSHWNTELTRINKTVKKVDEQKAKKERIKHILSSIDILISHQREPAQLLDVINTRLPPDVWLSKFSENDSVVVMDGFSFSDPAIATFMKNLEKLSDYFTNVELIETRQILISGEKVRRFKIQCGRKAKA